MKCRPLFYFSSSLEKFSILQMTSNLLRYSPVNYSRIVPLENKSPGKVNWSYILI